MCKLEQNEWTRLPKPIVVDSGAAETVIPEDWLPAHETKASPGSLKNEYYVTADGGKVSNQGPKSVVVSTADGKQCKKITFQVAPGIQKALGSVSQMVSNRNRVVFDMDEYGKDIWYILNKDTGGHTPMQYENGVYVMDMLVGPLIQHESPTSQGFHRQGW